MTAVPTMKTLASDVSLLSWYASSIGTGNASTKAAAAKSASRPRRSPRSGAERANTTVAAIATPAPATATGATIGRSQIVSRGTPRRSGLSGMGLPALPLRPSPAVELSARDRDQQGDEQDENACAISVEHVITPLSGRGPLPDNCRAKTSIAPGWDAAASLELVIGAAYGQRHPRTTPSRSAITGSTVKERRSIQVRYGMTFPSERFTAIPGDRHADALWQSPGNGPGRPERVNSRPALNGPYDRRMTVATPPAAPTGLPRRLLDRTRAPLVVIGAALSVQCGAALAT